MQKAPGKAAFHMHSGERRQPCGQAGFTYLGVLVLIVLIGIMLAGAGEVAHTTAQRERETELLFIGHQYRDAIGRYFQQNRRYPQELEDLLQTQNANPLPARYLRRLYRDPMTQKADWTLLRTAEQGIMGVASSSSAVPLKKARFEEADTGFEDAKTYADWIFTYDPRISVIRAMQHSAVASTAP